MANRKQIGLFYSYNQNWIGGTYYIENLLKALEVTPVKEFDFNILGSLEDFNRVSPKIKLPLIFFKRSFLQNVLTRVFKSNFFDTELEAAFPVFDPKTSLKIKKKIFWIPDFQDKHYPDFFSSEELRNREAAHLAIIESNNLLVLSSNDALKDLRRFYPQAKNKVFVLNFAVSNDLKDLKSSYDILSQYKLPSKYFICSNQFWKHKNHMCVLEAIAIVKKSIPDLMIVFTGKPHDHRAPEYYDELLQKIKDLEIEENVSFLGFIDRVDQLSLMKTSHAVVQPSLFEGWSTVIEDAKSLSKAVIASDIDVHKEQLGTNGYYFSSTSSQSLSEELIKVWNSNIQIINFEYDLKIIEFGRKFLTVINS